MSQVNTFDTHSKEYETWFDEHKAVYESELLVLSDQFKALPENIKGIEVGLGTGRYARSLMIKEGIEPAESLRKIAERKGIEVMKGVAENLPYKDFHYDFVLFVTICHLDDAKLALKEAYRVLNQKGSIIIGFIDGNSPLAEKYYAKKKTSTFYKQANFYSVEKVEKLLKEVGFKNLIFTQTLFDDIDDIKEVQIPKEGHGEGSFVVVRASR